MKHLTRREVSIRGSRTSIRLEPEFWSLIDAMARKRGTTLPEFIAGVAATRNGHSLAGALRVQALQEVQNNGA